jgi:hypothetical protein
MTRGRRPSALAIAVLLGLLSVLLGVHGYAAANRELSLTDCLYLSLQLFSLGGDVPTGGTPLALDVARFSAPATTLYTALLAAVVLLRDRVDAAWVRRRAKCHVVVIGLGSVGGRLCFGLRGRFRTVVGVEQDQAAPATAALRRSGVRVVVGDATRHVLDRLRLTEAAHVVVACGDDSLNLEVSDRVRRRLGTTGRLHVVVDDLGLWRELARLQLLDHAGTEHLHLADRAALQLLDVLDAGVELEALQVCGDDPLAARLVVHRIRRGLCAGSVPMTHVDDLLKARLQQEDPWVLAHLSEVATGSVHVFAGGTSGDAAAVAAALRAVARDPEARAYVTVAHEGSEGPLAVAGERGRRVVLVPPRLHDLGRELVDGSVLELLAKARHTGYVAAERRRGQTEQTNSSLLPWQDLPDSLRTSNRRYAASVAEVLRALRAELVPLTGPPTTDLVLDTDQVEVLAKAEHVRWMADLEADGWRPTSGEKDPERRLHPLLVPWDDLAEEDREKDRESVRDLPAMLAGVGYQLVVP